MQKNKNRPGYKKTKVGWIPSDWANCLGKDIAALITKGSSPNWQGFEYQSHGVLFVTSENVRDGCLDISHPKFLPLSFNDKQKKSQLVDGDILINIVGASIGRVCGYQDAGLPANVNQAVCVFRCGTDVCVVSTLYLCFEPKPGVVETDFLQLYFEAGCLNRELYKIVAEGARSHGLLNVTATDFLKTRLSLPNGTEQEAIAVALSSADAEISALERKLAALREQKRFLLNNMVTGTIRMPQFAEQHEEAK